MKGSSLSYFVMELMVLTTCIPVGTLRSSYVSCGPLLASRLALYAVCFGFIRS